MTPLERLRQTAQPVAETPAEVHAETTDDEAIDSTALVPTTNAPPPPKPVVVPPRLNPKAAAAAAAAQSPHAEDPTEFSEIRRIINIDTLPPLTPAEVDEFSRRNALAEAYVGKGIPAPFRFHEAQARAIYFFDKYGGLFGPLGCSAGKTLITQMIAERYWRRTAQANPHGRNVSLLLIPPEVYDQFLKPIGDRPSDCQWARKRVPLTVPFIGLRGLDLDRRMFEVKNKNGCFVMPHSLMSARDTTALLEVMQPGLVQVDEAHKFKNFGVARTKRLMNYVAKKKPKFVVLSGTMTNKSLKNHHHFLEPTVGDRSPLPLAPDAMLEWASVVDSDADPTEEMKKTLEPLVDWARFKFPKINFRQDISGFRLAQKLRLWTAPGVVATQDAPAPCPLSIQMIQAEHSVPEQEDALKALFAQVAGSVDPNGDPIEDARQMHGWYEQLTAGFYYKLHWPSVDTLKNRRPELTDLEAKDVIARSIERHAAGKLYKKALMEWMRDNPHATDQNGHPLDTPRNVGNDMYRHQGQNVGGQLYALWMHWKKSGIEPGLDPFDDNAGQDLIHRDSTPVPINSYKIRAAQAWVRRLRTGVLYKDADKRDYSQAGALIWYYHDHVGEWLTKALRLDADLYAKVGGVDGPFGVLHCPSGDNRQILDPKNKGKIIVAGSGHKTGKNLQHFEHQLMTQWYRPAPDLEQLLSRTHRTGQLADELTCFVLVAPTLTDGLAADKGSRVAGTFDERNIAATMRDATYAQQILGNRQRALLARWDPLPKMFDQTTLLELGFDVAKLGAKEEAFLKEKFG